MNYTPKVIPVSPERQNNTKNHQDEANVDDPLHERRIIFFVGCNRSTVVNIRKFQVSQLQIRDQVIRPEQQQRNKIEDPGKAILLILLCQFENKMILHNGKKYVSQGSPKELLIFIGKQEGQDQGRPVENNQDAKSEEDSPQFFGLSPTPRREWQQQDDHTDNR